MEALELAAAAGTELAALLVETAGAAAEEATTPDTAPTTFGMLSSSVLLDPVFARISAGQATCLKSTFGLSEPPNQSKRQSQPGCNLDGNVEQSVAAEIPPYCAPQPFAGAPGILLVP